MVLNTTVEDIMKDDNETCATYSNNASLMSGVESCVDLISDHQWNTTISLFTESRETLKELEITTLKLLSSASDQKYTE